jgi:protein-S-isoprenylcysteine O-methyltransferase Ste14
MLSLCLCDGFLCLRPSTSLLRRTIATYRLNEKVPCRSLHRSYFSDPLSGEGESNNSTILVDVSFLSSNKTDESISITAVPQQTPEVKAVEKLEQIQKQSQEVIQHLKTKSNRKQLFMNIVADTKGVIFTLLQNIRHGEYGKRGEELLFTQLALLGFVFFGMNSFLTIGIKIFSLISFFYGMHLLFRGIFDLKEQISPFIIPAKEHRVVDSGIYEQVRHPIYGGMMLLALGISIIAKDVYKLFVTIMLGLVLVSDT